MASTTTNRAAPNQPIYIASFPTPADDTYYFWLYYEALAKLGYQLLDTKGISLTREWLEQNAGKVGIIHFHWPAYIYSKKDKNEFRKSLRSFTGLLENARLLGYKIAWTVHNIFPHERNDIFLEYAARLYLAHYADVIFVHFRKAARTVSSRFMRFRNIHQIPHGNFLSVFPNTCTREQARLRLGLSSDAYVYLVFGPVRPYKGIEEAVHAFQAGAAVNDVLLLVGNASDQKIGDWVADQAKRDPRIVPHLNFVPKEEVQYFFNAASAVVLPYRRIFTSGNLFLALTFGRPVVCPDMGIISEVVDPSIGITYPPSSGGAGLAKALLAVKNLDQEQACRAARDKADSYTWEDAAAISAAAFQKCMRKSQP